jgi:hypothetical protein|tara:strand:+ start:193 stop:414 length:222 start_codon:yes stop_codon:yes gene_type:complete
MLTVFFIPQIFGCSCDCQLQSKNYRYTACMYVTLMVDGGGAIMDKNVLGIFTIFIMTPTLENSKMVHSGFSTS